MYIYLIKYNDEILAAAQNDKCATAVIYQYMKNNKDMKMELFETTPIRYVEDKEDEV